MAALAGASAYPVRSLVSVSSVLRSCFTYAAQVSATRLRRTTFIWLANRSSRPAGQSLAPFLMRLLKQLQALARYRADDY